MRVLSATDAINPAIEHAKALLKPFSLRLWLKLGFVAFIAEMSGQFTIPPVGNLHSPAHSAFPTSSGIGAAAGGITLLAIIAIGVIVFLIGLVLFYLGSRMQLVLMDLVATRTTLVAPAWHRTSPRTWRWIGLKLACFLTVIAFLAAVLFVPMLYLIRSMPSGNGQPPTPAFFGTFALFFITIFSVVMIILLMTWFLRDLVLPFILFEDAPLGTALRSATSIVRREPGSVLFYFCMKFALTLLASIAAELCILLAMIALGIPVGIVAGGLWLALRHAGLFATAVMYVSFALLGAIFLTALVCTILCIGGAVLIFYQTYALYFLGGRLPQLGDLLEPPPPPLELQPSFHPS